MLKQFKAHLEKKGLFQKEDRILLALSGGVDSVVLAHLFWQTGLKFGVAHCNFQLRGADADTDAAFVQALAQELRVPYYTVTFETTKIAEEQGLSIQMAARNLRYSWLEAQRQANGYAAIATAHHLDDSIETLLYNFTKGCGIHGLQGIPLRNGYVVRPLLFAHKTDILEFAKANEIAYREDASNNEDKYARNRIRHQVIPVLQTFNPAFLETAAANIQRLQDAAALMDWAVGELKKELTHTDESGRLRINLPKLRLQKAATTLLYEWLCEYGFHAAQLADILETGTHTGAIVYSSTHRLLYDREELILETLPETTEQEVFEIMIETSEIALPDGRLEFKNINVPESFSTKKTIACLALKASDFPLKLRHWQEGDTFQPFGMQGKKQKLQDFFSNLKLSRFDKSRVWILETANGHICWLVGLRMDERFKITAETPQCTEITWTPRPS